MSSPGPGFFFAAAGGVFLVLLLAFVAWRRKRPAASSSGEPGPDPLDDPTQPVDVGAELRRMRQTLERLEKRIDVIEKAVTAEAEEESV